MNRKISVLGAVLVVPAAAMALDPIEFPAFKAVDTDNNGFLSRDEVRVAIPEVLPLFSRVDANMDDQLSPAEYETALRLLSTPPSSS